MRYDKIEVKIKDPSYCKSLKDPMNGAITHVETLLSFEEANKLRRGNANVRPPEPKKRPFRAMMNTVENEPNFFHLKNRGITYICSNIDLRDNTLVISIPNANGETKDDEFPRYGIADGGHTFEVITQTIAGEKEGQFDAITRWAQPYVRVHFLVTKDQENIESIVESLNTSSQVQNYTLDEYQGKFEELKKALDKSGFDPELVSFRENEDKEWHVVEVIQRMACFLKDRWVSTQPTNMYKSKGKALKLYTNEDTRAEFRMLYPVIKDVITLPEFIQHKFSKGDFISGKSLAKLKGVKRLRKTDTRPGTEYPSDHRIDLAGLLPIAAGFRELLVKRGDRYVWKLDYKDVFEYCAKDLYAMLVKHSGQVAMSSQLSSDVEFWAGCASLISRARNDMMDENPPPPEKVIRRRKQQTDGSAEEEEEYSTVSVSELRSEPT